MEVIFHAVQESGSAKYDVWCEVWGLMGLWFGVEEQEISAQLFEGLNKYQIDSIIRSSIWTAVRMEWGKSVKSKLGWWKREMSRRRDNLGEGREGTFAWQGH